MAVDIKSLKNRIKSVDSTLHLTKAMGLVASAKIRGATDSMNKGRRYAKSVSDIIAPLTSAKECEKSIYMNENAKGKLCVIVIAGDRGLAGGYNANIFKIADAYKDAEIIPIGKRTSERYEKPVIKTEAFGYKDATQLSRSLCEKYRNGEYSKIIVLSTKYVSMMTQTPIEITLLPLEKMTDKSLCVLYEPDEKFILEAVMEEYITAKLLEATKESFACEVVARRFAMDSAGKNAGQMIDNLKLEYNRARQGAITQEITEIVAGSGE